MQELGSHGSQDLNELRRKILAIALGITVGKISIEQMPFLERQTLLTPSIVPEEFLPQCAATMKGCWHILNGKGLAVVEEILEAYIPSLISLSLRLSQYQQVAARIAVQAHFLNSVIAKHRLKFAVREMSCLQAIQCSIIAEDPLLEAASRMYLAYTYIYCSPLRPRKAIEMFQEALSLLGKEKSLLHSDIYIGLADAYAMCKESQQAFNAIALAQEYFPSQPEHDLSFPYAGCSLNVIYQYEGKMFLDLAEHDANQQYYRRGWDALVSSTKVQSLSEEVFQPETKGERAHDGVYSSPHNYKYEGRGTKDR